MQSFIDFILSMHLFIECTRKHSLCSCLVSAVDWRGAASDEHPSGIDQLCNPMTPGTSIRRRRTHMIDRFHWRITANEATSWQERIPRKLTEGKGVPFATLLEPTPKTEKSKRGFPKGGTTSGTPKREITCQTRQNSSRGMLVAEKRSSFRDPWCPRMIGVALSTLPGVGTLSSPFLVVICAAASDIKANKRPYSVQWMQHTVEWDLNWVTLALHFVWAALLSQV